jgi:glycosyltransferase involved in cell wall biosynthesis
MQLKNPQSTGSIFAMYHGSKIAVCIPAHNEERHIRGVVEKLPDFIDIIIVVDDHSTDSTYEVVSTIDDPRLICIHHTENRGVGGSTVSGHEIACKNGADVIIRMDGDDQMDPYYLSSLIEPITQGITQYTKGNRLVSREERKQMPKIRVFGNYVLTYMNKILTGYWSIMDSQNGYTAISRDALEKIDYQTLARGYMFENDMLFRLNQMNVPVLDIPMPAYYADEVSGIRIFKVIPEYLHFFSIAAAKRLWRKYILRFHLAFAVAVLCFFLLVAGGCVFMATQYWGRALVTWLAALVVFFVGIGIDIQNEPGLHRKPASNGVETHT